MKRETSQSMRKVLSPIRNHIQGGFSLVEIICASALFALLVVALLGAYLYGEEAQMLAGNRARAVLIAKEGLEAARNIRDASFANLSDGAHGLITSGNQWSFSGTSDTSDIFTRQIVISSIDAKRKNVTANVTWRQNELRNGTVSLATELSSWLGAKKGSAPSLIACMNLDVANSGNEAADGISIATQGNYVYLGRQNNNGYEFFVFDVTTPSTPVLLGKVATGDTANDIAVSGNYAYIASSDNAGELTVVDVSAPTALSVAAKFNLTAANSGNANADGLAVAIGGGDRLYLTRTKSAGKELYVFDISAPTVPALLGSVDLNGDIREIGVSGNYVYAASGDNTQEFQVIDVATPSAPVLAASLNLDQGATQPDAFSIAIGVNTVYVGRDGSAASEFYIIDTTTPTSPSIVSTLDVGTHILQSIDYNDALKFVFFANTATGAEDYQVIDVSNPAAPTLLTNVNLNGTPYKVVYSSAKDAVMIASGYDSCELQIISP
ncbi:prepilin-type N-terminal cleavage/methylation domain-containing protein [Candidatus Uhrbacteria bacterium]|nr:prepilin-type N-terminal cleavage/methylation domain-containing protein [Candidatus Uhrbacteria bacterium]